MELNEVVNAQRFDLLACNRDGVPAIAMTFTLLSLSYALHMMTVAYLNRRSFAEARAFGGSLSPAHYAASDVRMSTKL
jgi:hypothetical protein